ncbi:DoxX family protein [bacterium]|nr:MAG: DoxX family protein [bacterium]
MKADWFSAYRGPALSLLRLVAGFNFMSHGLQKTFGFLGGQTFPALSLAGVAGYLELIGGTLIMVGLFTRPTGFVLSGMMAFAYFIGHASRGFWPVVNQGELASLYFFLFLYFVFSGAGPWSLDALRKRR